MRSANFREVGEHHVKLIKEVTQQTRWLIDNNHVDCNQCISTDNMRGGKGKKKKREGRTKVNKINAWWTLNQRNI